LGILMTRRHCLLAYIFIFFQPTVFAASALPVPPGAKGVQYVQLYGGRHKQVSYVLSVPYPDDRAVTHYRSVLTGWRECRTAESSWQSFGDLAVKPPRFVHQLLRAWVRPDNRAVATLALVYVSPGVEYRVSPETDKQRVVMIVSASANADEEVRDLGYVCSKDAQPGAAADRPTAASPLSSGR
jgi:hypothetical protein